MNLKKHLRTFTQMLTFVVTVVLVSSVNLPQSSFMPGKKLGLIAAGKTVVVVAQNTQNSDDTSSEDSAQNTSTVDNTEDFHDDLVLQDQTHLKPFGYSVFIPEEPLPLIGHFIPPLHRPPLA